jgi:hypothetical protein
MRAETPSAGSSRRGHYPKNNRTAASRAACRLSDQTMLVTSGCHLTSRRCNAYPAAKVIATGTASRKRSITATTAAPCNQFMVSLLPGANSARHGHRSGLRRSTQMVVMEMYLCLSRMLQKAGESIPHMPSTTTSHENQQRPFSILCPIYRILLGDDRRRDNAVIKL